MSQICYNRFPALPENMCMVTRGHEKRAGDLRRYGSAQSTLARSAGSLKRGPRVVSPSPSKERKRVPWPDNSVYPTVGRNNPNGIVPPRPEIYQDDVGHRLIGEYTRFCTRSDEVISDRCCGNTAAKCSHAQIPGSVVVFAFSGRPSLGHGVQRRLRTLDRYHVALAKMDLHGVGPADIASVHFRFNEHGWAPPRAIRVTVSADICSATAATVEAIDD